MSEEGRAVQLPKELIVAVPLIGTAIAITFDVGYFSAIDINFFTLFSLSEHIVFSLEAMPLALIGSIIIVLQIPTIHLSDKVLARFLNKTSAKSWRYRLVRGFLYLSLIGSMSYWFYIAYENGWAWLMAASSFFGLFVVLAGIARPLVKSSFFLILYVATAIFITTFFIGWDSAKSYVGGSDALQVLTLSNNQELGGRLIRSGDKGVMFATSDKDVLFIRWDNINRIDSHYNAVMDKILHHN